MLQEKRLEQLDYVIKNAEHVKLNKEKLDMWIEGIKTNLYYEHQWKKYKNKFSEKEIILLSFLVESMNFCFWKEPVFTYKEKKKSEAMFGLFIDAVLNDRNLLNLEYLKDLKYEDLINIFKVEEGNLKKRYDSLMYSINKIRNNNNFYEDLFKIKSTDELYEFIADFENFNDIASYKGRYIFFYKRATLLVNDLFELSDTIKNNIQNIDSVLGCADYVIPKGLRNEGILEYDNELSSLIDNGIEIKQASEYEVEIRAFTLWVIEYTKNKINININSSRLDNIIWNIFHGKQGIAHKTDTIFY